MPTTDLIFATIKDSILDLKDLDEADVVPEASVKGLGLDSLDFVEMQVILKRKFGVHVHPAAFAEGRITTLAEFASHVQSLAAVPA